jgi:FkbM family methyltransferase
MGRRTSIAMRCAIAVLAVTVAVLSIAVVVYPPARFGIVALRNRSDACGPTDIYPAWKLVAARIDASAAVKPIRRDGQYELHDTPLGRLWAPARNSVGMKHVVGEITSGLYSQGSGSVRKGDVVLDCGANVGVYTRLALNQGAALVVAIDIMPENLASLRRNFASEISEKRVIVYGKGVWDRETTLPIYDSESTIDSSVVPVKDRARSHITVPVTTIDAIAKELALPRVDVIKLDIEGAEHEALRGAQSTVDKFRPRLVVALEHNQHDVTTIPAQIRQQWPFMAISPGPCDWVTGYDTEQLQPHIMIAYPR